jgi:hypothetical protein
LAFFLLYHLRHIAAFTIAGHQRWPTRGAISTTSKEIRRAVARELEDHDAARCEHDWPDGGDFERIARDWGKLYFVHSIAFSPSASGFADAFVETTQQRIEEI